MIQDAGYINGIAQEARITELSEDQEKALDFVNNFMKSNKKQAIIGGCAGSGKSSIIPFIIDKFNKNKKNNSLLSPFFVDEHESVMVCAYTGKAVMVLKRKGIVNAQTLHSFLYKTHCEMDADGNKRITHIPHPSYYFQDVKLLIVDEASMINSEMYNLISSLPFKTLYIGDHFQLPPINDNFNIMLKPDFKMEKVLRQNENNPIIQLAEMARNGQKIPLGIYGSSKHTLKLNEDELLNYDQILTWTNATKDKINEIIRYKRGFVKDIPQFEDKMIVKVNCPAYNLFNGQIVYLMNTPVLNKKGAWEVELIDELAYLDPFIMAQTDKYIKARASIHLSKEELNEIRLNPYKKIKTSNNMFGKIVKKYPYEIHLDWGYALTVHSAQGSSWENIGLILDKRIYNLKDYQRWLYTAITRAENSITIYSGDFKI